jgi:hypothetical protein
MGLDFYIELELHFIIALKSCVQLFNYKNMCLDNKCRNIYSFWARIWHRDLFITSMVYYCWMCEELHERSHVRSCAYNVEEYIFGKAPRHKYMVSILFIVKLRCHTGEWWVNTYSADQVDTIWVVFIRKERLDFPRILGEYVFGRSGRHCMNRICTTGKAWFLANNGRIRIRPIG